MLQSALCDWKGGWTHVFDDSHVWALLYWGLFFTNTVVRTLFF